MKNVLLLLLLLIFSFISVFFLSADILAQEPSSFIVQSSCDNHNTFFKSGDYGSLQDLVDTIYPNGIVYFDPSKVQEVGQEAILEMLNLDEGISFELKGT